MQSDLVMVVFISALPYNTVEINKTHSRRPQKKSIHTVGTIETIHERYVGREKAYFLQKSRHKARHSPGGPISIPSYVIAFEDYDP